MLRISSGDDVVHSDHIEAEVLSVRGLVSSLLVLASFVRRPFSSVPPKDQCNVDALVLRLLQLSKDPLNKEKINGIRI